MVGGPHQVGLPAKEIVQRSPQAGTGTLSFPCLLDTVTLNMSEYHRAALKCESPQALRDISQRNSQVILRKGCSDLAGACYESLPALFSKQLRARKSTLNSDISSAGCRVLLFGVLEWGDPQHMGNKRQEHTQVK